MAIRGYGIPVGRPVYLSHPSSLGHVTGPHPERAERIGAIESELAIRGDLDLERARSRPATVQELQAVHHPSYVDAIRRTAESGGGSLDLDTIVSYGSWEAALHAAGGALDLVDRLLCGHAPSGFSSHRPPGHHAERARAMGFCLFNNVAVAARHALDAHGLARVLVLDWDVHHGNGTNNLFHDSPAVLYASIHQSDLYPGTGAVSDRGRGLGEGYTLNLPVPPGSGDERFIALLEHVVVPVALSYEPELVLVSAGYDAHVDDPLAQCRVTDSGYRAMTSSVRGLSAALGVPLGVVLEGGYALAALGRSVVETLSVLAADDVSRDGLDVPVDAAVTQARERVAERWRLPAA